MVKVAVRKQNADGNAVMLVKDWSERLFIARKLASRRVNQQDGSARKRQYV
jgi:hypothetical protein